MKKVTGLLLWFMAWQSSAQVTLRLISLPEKYTPPFDTLFVAGNFNNWNPRDTAFRFKKNGQGQLQTTISTTENPLLFKITRGNWASVEVAANGQDIPNRSQPNNSGTVDIPVADWADTKGSHTATAQVSVLTSQLWLKSLKRFRRIWVCLPPDYQSNPARRYPVIYLHDGQNLFDAATSFSGEWKVDEALASLAQQPGWEPIIAVGIDNGGGERINELTPFRNPTYGGGQGELYGRDVVESVKPLIDSLFRTKPDRQNTAVGGSSLGGIETLYMGYAWPQVFSKQLVFSPSLWYSDSLQNFLYSQPQPSDVRIHLLAGTNESANMVAQTNDFYNGLISAGFPAANISKNIVTGGTHSEGFWSQHVKSGLEFLFAIHTDVKKKAAPFEKEIKVGQINGRIEIVQVEGPIEITPQLVDILGKKIELKMEAGGRWTSSQLKPGIYFIHLTGKDFWETEKIWIENGF